MSPHSAALADEARLAAVRRTGLLDTPPEEAFDRLARLASRALAAPVGLVTLVDVGRVFVKSSVGWAGRREVPPDHTYCAQVVASGAPFLLSDARVDARFREAPACVVLGGVACLAVPLTCEGHVVGAVSVTAPDARAWTADDVAALEDVAAVAAVALVAHARPGATLRDDEALSEVLGRFELVQRATNDTIWDWDFRTGTITWNERISGVFGYAADVAKGDPGWWSSHLHPDDRAQVTASFEAALAKDETWTHEYRFRRADGSYAVVFDRGLIQRDASGAAVRALGTMQDITERVEAKQRLEASEAEARLNLSRLEAVLRALPVGVFITDPEGVVQVTNPAAVAMWGGSTPKVGIDGYDAYRARRTDTGARVSPDDWPVARALRTGVAVRDEEVEIEAFDGERRVVLTSGLLIRDEAQRLLGGIAVNLDVTERRRAQQALRESEAKFRSLIENGSDLITIMDEGGRTRYQSPALGRMLGHAPEDVADRIWIDLTHPEDRPALRALTQEVASRPGVPVPFTTRLRHQDGTYRWLEGVATNLLDDPAVRGIVTNSHDITERIRVKESLRTSNAVLRTLFDSSPLPIVTTDPEGRVELWNPAAERTFGWRATEVAGRALPFVAEEHLTENAELRRKALAGQAVTGVEVKRRRKDGTVVELNLSFAPLRGPDGQVRGIISVHEDITERVQAAALLEAYARELERSNRELQEFAYVASHDLQEPLRKIQSFGDRLRMRYAETLGEQGDDYLRRMQEAARRMQQLIQDLLAFSRVGSSTAPFTRVDLEALLAEVTADVEGRLQATGGTIRHEPLPAIDGSPTHLRQLLQNVVGNALKYHRPGVPPTVDISASPYPRDPRVGRSSVEWIELRITDNGIGFEPQHAERIFAPFQRLHGRGEYEGTGMGLTICRKIVERHGGTISATSTPGVGSTFVIALPRTQRSPGDLP